MNVTVFCFFASYVVAFVADATRLSRSWLSLRLLVVGFTAAGLLAHTLYLLRQSEVAGLPPLLSSPQDWFLVLAWVIGFGGLVLALLTDRPATGLFLMPAVLLLISVSLLTAAGEPSGAGATAIGAAAKRWATLHAGLILMGIAAVVIGLMSSLMYLAQHRRLKSGRLTAVSDMGLFSLEQLAGANRVAVIASVVLLALGLAAGAALGTVTAGGDPVKNWLDPLVVASSVGWIGLVAFLLWSLRAGRTTSGRVIAIRTALVCGLLVATLLGLKVVTGGTLSLSNWHS